MPRVLSQPTRSGNHGIWGTLPKITFKEPVVGPALHHQGSQSEDGNGFGAHLHWNWASCYQGLWVPNRCSNPSFHRWYPSSCQLLHSSSHTNFIHLFISQIITEDLLGMQQSICTGCSWVHEDGRQVHRKYNPVIPEKAARMFGSIEEVHLIGFEEVSLCWWMRGY